MSDAVTRSGNTTETYGGVAKVFHWVTAFLIFTAFPLGMAANNWAFDSAEALQTKFLLFSLHKTVGVAAFLVALLRIGWAIGQPKPGTLHPDRKAETFLASMIHWLLYGSLVLVPLSGWLHHAATEGFAPILWPFGQSLPLVPQNASVAHFFEGWHFVFTKVLAVAVLLHVAGALKHLFVDRDKTLARMLPGTTHVVLPPQRESRTPMIVAFLIYAVAMAGGAAIGLSAPSPVTTSTGTSTSSTSTGWIVREGSLEIVVEQNGAKVQGSFEDWSAEIEFDADANGPVLGNVTVEISIPSLQLGTITQQVLVPELFAAEEFPKALFSGDILKDEFDEDSYISAGTLTLKGIEIPIILPFSLELADNSARMSGELTLDRRDFNIGTDSYKDENTVGFSVDVIVTLVADKSAP